MSLGLLPALLVFLAGCFGGPAKDAPTTASVSGVVTRKGAPLPGAQLTFTPVENPGAKSYGNTNEDGEYELVFSSSQMGALIGKHKVSIHKDSEFDDEGVPIPNPVIIPPQYNTMSEMEVDVPEDGLSGGPANFDLDF